MNCFRWFGFKSLDEVDRLTPKEYMMLCEAEKLKQLDRKAELSLNAWLSFVATATKKVGKSFKPVYPTFDSFFDYTKELKALTGENISNLKERYKALNERLTGNVSTHNRSDIDSEGSRVHKDL